jgi:signal peptidase I
MRLLKELLLTLLFALVIFLGLRLTVQSFRVEGSSMMPGIHNGEWLVVNKLEYILHKPERGDVIVFEPPQWPSTDYIKRVIGVPGDKVEVHGGTVYVNGNALDEPYINERPDYVLSSTTVPPNLYFVLGDNRNFSQDSHTGYMVPTANIVGKAWVSLWPPPM